MEVTAGMIICGVGAGGIVISVIVLLVTFSLFPKQRRRLLNQIEDARMM